MSSTDTHFWTTVAPNAWPAPPKDMTVSALSEIETCPRRWALGSAEYPDLWAGRGYPPKPALSSLSGSVVHFAIETITKAFVQAGCASVQDACAVQAMQELGGYTKVINDCIDSLTDRYNRNPRATRFLDGVRRTLRGQIPILRARTQTLLSRVRLAATTARTVGQTARRPLSIGTYSEVELCAPDLGWKGKAGRRLHLAMSECEPN